MSSQSKRAAAVLLLSAAATLMIGLHGVKGDPRPAEAPANPATTILRSPSLWQIVKTDDRHPAAETSRMCINSPGGLATLFKGIKPDGRCTQSTSTLADGGRVIETHCKSIPGAKWSESSSARIEASSDVKTIHQHTEVQFPDLDPPLNKTHVSDAVMTYLGDCPVPMRPDQFMLLQGDHGRFVDPLSEMTKALRPAPAPQSAPKP